MRVWNIYHLGSTAISAQEPFEQAAFAISPSEIETNSSASAAYDAKFKQNDMVIVRTPFGFQPVRVSAKSGNIYKVVYATDIGTKKVEGTGRHGVGFLRRFGKMFRRQ